MSLVSTRLSLIHLATIQRNAATDDSWGNPGSADWQDHLVDQVCRLYVQSGRETVTDKTTIVVVEDLRLILTLGTDVTEQDRVSTVSYRGDEILAGAAGIRTVLHRPDHLELILLRIA